MLSLLPEPKNRSHVTRPGGRRPGSWGSCLAQRWLQGFLGLGPFPSGVGGPPTLELSMISGARYQRVATYSVRKPVWSCSGSAMRARPKSQIWKPTQAAKLAAPGPMPEQSYRHATAHTVPFACEVLLKGATGHLEAPDPWEEGMGTQSSDLKVAGGVDEQVRGL